MDCIPYVHTFHTFGTSNKKNKKKTKKLKCKKLIPNGGVNQYSEN